MCNVLGVHHSGFYAWLKCPQSPRALEDKRLLGLIKQFWMESGFAYGYRNITKDLKDHGEHCGKNRVHRIMCDAQIRSQRGYKRHRGFKGGGALNTLDRQFQVQGPNQSWVTDFTYIRAHEGWLYLTIVWDLFSRQIIGWSMKNNPRADLVIDALLMPLWRRKPNGSNERSTKQGLRLGQTSSITLSCTTTQNADMETTTGCLQPSSKKGI